MEHRVIAALKAHAPPKTDLQHQFLRARLKALALENHLTVDPILRFAGLVFFAALLVVCALAVPCSAQDNYEIQVYEAETVAPRSTMVEIHSNFTVEGSKTVQDGMLPTNHAEHETLEITQGINDWAEVGFYLFTSIQPGDGWQWVGDHIRPRVRVPERWHWPVGLSLSN